MNCFNHPNTIIVATCNDCHKGLCSICSKTFEIPICISCNKNRIKLERKALISNLIYSLGFGFFFIFFFNVYALKIGLFNFRSLVYLYIGFSIVYGWKFVSKFMPDFILTMPIIGWLIFYLLKFVSAYFLGIVITPFYLIRDVRKLIKLNKIMEIQNEI